jgi:AbrB family looped-hinge helix DNA binding protein
MTRELFSTVTTKGQVTIPQEVRRVLGVTPHDKVVFVVDGDEVRLLRGGSVVARTAGALRSTLPPLTAEELRAAAEQVIADDVMERMGS